MNSLAPSRRAITLIEMLVALAITLLMMGGVVTMFGVVAESIGGSRATIEMSQRLRSARERLQQDLSSTTATMIPSLRPESDEGYFEYIEGPSCDWNDGNRGNPRTGPYTRFGDLDDVLMFTVRSRGEPFVGKLYDVKSRNTSTIESQVAEVAWFARPTLPLNPNNPTYTLYRRVLLVAPHAKDLLNAENFRLSISGFQQNCDLSAHVDVVSGTVVLNTLGDLTKRENRYQHASADTVPGMPAQPVFPFAIPYAKASSANLRAPALAYFDNNSGRLGEDLVLTNVLSFDVRAWDPTATTTIKNNSIALAPTDQGYDPSDRNQTPSAPGAYVDLAYVDIKGVKNKTPSFFSGAPDPRSGLQAFPTYDTWSMHYMTPGPWNGYSDKAVNGLDDDNNGVVDDPGESVVQPPYAVPLRGIQVKIRCYESDSRQVREVTVVQDFLPE